MTFYSLTKSSETSSICGFEASVEISSHKGVQHSPAHNSDRDESELFMFFTCKCCACAIAPWDLEYFQKIVPINTADVFSATNEAKRGGALTRRHQLNRLVKFILLYVIAFLCMIKW